MTSTIGVDGDIHMEIARNIQVVFFDVDGVFTDNRVLEGATSKPKWRSYYDGQGVSLLRAIGIRVCLITNAKGDDAKHIVDVVEKWNNLPSSSKKEGDGGWHHVKLYMGMGEAKKVLAAEDFLKETGVPFEKCAFMGDDLVDVPLMRKVALRAAPVSGENALKNIAHFVSVRNGGYGAARDFVNFVLACRGVDPTMLASQ